MSGTVKVVEMTVDGAPVQCPECDAPGFTLDGGRFETEPAHANCDYSHHWTDPQITGATLVMILGSRTGRTKARHNDTFDVTYDGTHLAGTLHPEIVYDDVRQGAKAFWKRGLKPQLRRRRRALVRAATKPGKQVAKKAARKVRGAAEDAAASVKTAAVTAAWDMQAGGHEANPGYTPEPATPCGAGCTKGYFPLDSRIHGMPQVVCTACRGTGETL
ncbi:hypothetical protein ACIRF8_15400 [Streptomyces sp. NPDC102406]|uniref:hypothetical protein n=1 Tax=Streptomyces sp. NPDC102406 TaxID=3366171 RepID=UPI00381F1473